MQIDLLQLMTDLYMVLGVQVLFFPSLTELSGRLDYDLRRRLFKDFHYGDYLRSVCADLEPGILYHIEDDFRLFYSLLFIPDSLRAEYSGCYFFLGPVMFHPLSEDSFKKIVQEKRIAPILFNDLNEFYGKIPIFPSFDTWASFAAIFSSRLMKKDVESRTCRYGTFCADYIPSDFIFSENSELSRRIIDCRYEAETRLIKAVSVANMKKALAAYNCILQYRISPRTEDVLRNSKNMCIILNTLLRKAAQLACVHSWYIDRLSTSFALQIESAASRVQFDFLPSAMIRQYCVLVSDHSRLSYSTVIRSCLDYIEFHYTEELTLRILAEKCSVTPCYLSARFRKEVHMTLTDYIVRARIEKSLVLLSVSASPIQEIAFDCGFSDPNYFTRVFKRVHKKTPREYRQKVRQNKVALE